MTHYPYRFIQYFKPQSDFWKKKSLYSFISTKTHQCYWVWVEEYEYHMYVVKFHLKSHRHSDNKYSILTNLKEPRQIINTCIQIMLEVYKSDPLSSFGLIGSNSEGEQESETKRYKVYSTILATYFGNDLFEHIASHEKSAYMLIRKTELEKDPDLAHKLESMFEAYYPYFSDN